MNSKTILFGALCVCASIFISSCKKDTPDSEAPIIAAVEEPLMNDTLFTGNELHIEASISDNEELSQLKIDVHAAEDGHNHGKVDASAYWETVVIIDLSGASTSIHEHIDIPTDAASGMYHVILTAVDKAGNQSEIVERDIFIQNAGDQVAPIVTITSPSQNDTISLSTGINVSAILTDNIGLEDADLLLLSGSTVVFETEIALSGTEFNLNQTIPTSTLAAGTYTIELVVRDAVQNVSDMDIEVVLVP
jgi:hypothetical protein